MSQVASFLSCAGCSAQIAPALLACPGCGRLVHAEQLQRLAAEAREASARGERETALARWREALDLLPPDSRQRQAVLGKIAELSPRASDAAARGPSASPAHSNAGTKAAAGLGGLALLLWKLKFAALLLLTKGKLLLLGLTKASTLFSMLLTLGVYWAAWGWKFALGLVLSIYVHEMGHVIALRRLGFKATAPLFIPGLGAFIRLRQNPGTPREDAEIGLAGPIYGLGAAAVALGIFAVTHRPIFAAIAGVGAWINLFNLLPVWTLDGGRAFRALSRQQRLLIAATVGGAMFVAPDGMLVLLLLVILGRVALEPGEPTGDRRATTQFIVLVILLALVASARHLARI